MLLLENSFVKEENPAIVSISNLEEITGSFELYQLSGDASNIPNPIIKQEEEIRDHFNTASTITIFLYPIFYSKSQIIRKGKSTFFTSEEAVGNSLLLLQCYLYPSSESFQVAVKPPGSAMRTECFQQLHKYQTEGKNLRYLTGDGDSLLCESRIRAFNQLSSFLGRARRENSSKQLNIFVQDFEIFKNLMAYKEFSSLLRSCENIVTLFNQSTSSLARVPNIPLNSLPDYLNTILSRDSSCVLHKEHVSNVFSGRKL